MKTNTLIDQNTRKQGLKKRSVTIFLLFMLFSWGLVAQPYNPGNPNYNFTYNTGVSTSGPSLTPGAMTISSITPGTTNLTWSVSASSQGGGSQAISMPVSTVMTGPCFMTGNNYSGGPQWSWITLPAYTTCGATGCYSCVSGGTVADAYFSTAVNMPTSFAIPYMVRMQIFAADFIQDINLVNVPTGMTYTVYNAGTVPNVPNFVQRNTPVEVSICDFKTGMNYIVIHIRPYPGASNTCKYMGIQTRCWSLPTVPNIPAYTTITGSPNICAGATSVFTAPSAVSLGYGPPIASTYSWTKPAGWGGSSTTATISVTAGNNNGVLIGSLYNVSNSKNKYCLATGGYSINVSPSITVSSPPSVCYGNTAVLSVSGANTYTWYNASNNSPISYLPNVTIGPLTQQANVALNAVTPAGCKYQKNLTVLVSPNPIVNINAYNTTLCQGTGSAQLVASGSVGNTYSWSPMSLPNSTMSSVFVQPPVTTVYYLTGTNPAGCTVTKQTTVTVNPSPTIAAANPSAICSGTTTTITASGGTSYTWSPPTTIGPGPIVVTPSVTTIYTVTGKNSFNCTKTVTVQVNVNASPTVVSTPTAVCPGISNTLVATGAMSYTWTVWPTALPSNTTVYTNTNSIIISPTGPVTYSICGKGANGCVRCITINMPMGSPIPISVADLTMCTTASNCTVLSAGTPTTAGCVWNLPGSPTGNTVNICPTSFPTQVVVTATSSAPATCPNSATLSISQVTNCCGQPTTGLTYISSMQGTMASNSYLLDHPVTLGNNTFMKDAEVWITPNGKITVPTGLQLDLDHVHLFACTNYMWEGIKIQKGAMLTTPQMTLNQHANSLIEDAKIAVDVDYSTFPSIMAATNFTISMEGVIFNKNNIGVRLYSPTNSVSISDGLGLNGCIFTSRNLPFTTYTSALSWPSSAMVSPGLKVASNPTTGLNPPYIFPGMPIVNTKAPFNTVPGFAGIQIKNLVGANPVNMGTLSCNGAVVLNINPGSSIYDDFTLFDGLSYGIDIDEASLLSKNLVFQNMDPSTGGDGVRQTFTSTAVGCFELFPSQGNGSFGMRSWDCVRGLNLRNVYNLWVTNSVFRSTQTAGTAMFPNMPGNYGIYANTNRFFYNISYNEFNNLKKGVSFNTPLTTQLFDVNGSGPMLGVYADLIYVWGNYFGAQVTSSTPYTGGQANTMEYMETAVEMLTPNPVGWTLGGGNGFGYGGINYNKIDRVFRGINVDCMWDFPLEIKENSVLVEDDYTFGTPGMPLFGYGISLSNSTDNKTISTNTLEAMGNALANNNVSLVYCDYNLGQNSPHVHCNMTKNCHYGFQFNFRNIGTIWEGNRMCNEWAGLALTNNGVIGQQGSGPVGCENFWEDSPASGCDQWSGAANGFNSKWNTYCDNSLASLSPLYVFPAPMAVPNMNGNSPGGVAYQGNDIQMSAAHNMQLVDCAKTNSYMPTWRVTNGSSTSGVNEAANSFTEDQLRVFPNPTDGQLSIFYGGDASNCQLKVLDLQGRLVYTKEIQSGVGTSVDLKDLPASVYLLEIKQGTKVVRKKLIKTN